MFDFGQAVYDTFEKGNLKGFISIKENLKLADKNKTNTNLIKIVTGYDVVRFLEMKGAVIQKANEPHPDVWIEWKDKKYAVEITHLPDQGEKNILHSVQDWERKEKLKKDSIIQKIETLLKKACVLCNVEVKYVDGTGKEDFLGFLKELHGYLIIIPPEGLFSISNKLSWRVSIKKCRETSNRRLSFFTTSNTYSHFSNSDNRAEEWIKHKAEKYKGFFQKNPGVETWLVINSDNIDKGTILERVPKKLECEIIPFGKIFLCVPTNQNHADIHLLYSSSPKNSQIRKNLLFCRTIITYFTNMKSKN